MFFLVFIGMFVGSLLVYRAQKIGWSKKILLEAETILYEQSKTTLFIIRPQNVRHGMAWLFVRVTNKRIFFLYPDKRKISLIIDFTNTSENTLSQKVKKVVTYVDKKHVNVKREMKDTALISMEGVNFFGLSQTYEFVANDKVAIRKALEL